MKRILIVMALVAIALVGWSIYADFNDSSAGTAPNGEPIGAQHPRSEQ